MSGVVVPAHIVSCAVRYALGRSSYIVGDVCDLVTGLAEQLGEQRAVIAEDVRRWLDNISAAEIHYHHPADVQRWEALLARLEAAA